ILSPLASLFQLASTLWTEIANLPSPRHPTWNMNIGFRYRLARMCWCRVDMSSSDVPPYLGVVNLVHIQKKSKVRDLKWFGRMCILVILFAQYVQAAILLTRRIMADAASTIDLAMSFMVLSGLVGLSQSLIISLVNVSWTLDPNFVPCVKSACRIPDCIAYKASQSLPNDVFHVIVFGYNITSIPRSVRMMVAGGYLQFDITQHNHHPFWTVLLALMGLQFIWRTSVEHLV
ncbi:hypothetical protein P153DRAFT_262152, partial [Dothidotthia symphoricarpi CBS 119687]